MCSQVDTDLLEQHILCTTHSVLVWRSMTPDAATLRLWPRIHTEWQVALVRQAGKDKRLELAMFVRTETGPV